MNIDPKKSGDILRLEGALKDRVLVGPKSVSCGITRQCNLACRYCLENPFPRLTKGLKQEVPDYIDDKRFAGIVDDCRDLKVEKFCFCGGEPSLHPKLKQMIAFLKKKNMPFSMNTNGTFDRALREELLNASALHINLSGTNGEDYRLWQGGSKGLYEKVLDNIKYMAKHKNRGPAIDLVYVLHRHNFRGMKKMITLAKDCGADSIQFKMMRFNKNMKDLAITKDCLINFKRILNDIFQEGSYKKIKTNVKEIARLLAENDFKNTCEKIDFYGLFEGDFYFQKTFDRHFSCYYGWFAADIGPWGHVFFCCTGRLTYLGNIYDKTFKEIWNSPYAHRIRLAMKHNFDINKKFWKPCTYCKNVAFNEKAAQILTCLAKT